MAAAASAASPDGARAQAQIVMPTNEKQRAFQEQIGYSDAIVVDGIVYISGVPAYLAPGETDVEKAYDRAFKAIGKTLERAGVSFDDVVSITTYHTKLTDNFEAFAKVKSNYIKGPPPAWTAIGTNALLQPGGLVEIALVAHVPKKAAK